MVFVGKLLQMVFVMKIINSIADIDGNRINCVYDIIDELFCPVYGMKDRIKIILKFLIMLLLLLELILI